MTENEKITFELSFSTWAFPTRFFTENELTRVKNDWVYTVVVIFDQGIRSFRLEFILVKNDLKPTQTWK